MHRKGLCLNGILVATSLLLSCAANAAVVNGDFATGDFTGWTTFTTSGGSLGPVDANTVTSFDVSGTGASQAARFQVGQSGGSFDQGGGIYQSVVVGAGTLSVSADIAAWDSTSGNGSNSD